MGRGMRGPTQLKAPVVRLSPRWIMNSVKSRTSMIWTGSVPSPGARTSPPRWMRTGQYVKRSVSSPGPMIRPGRTTVTRPGMMRMAVRSDSALASP